MYEYREMIHRYIQNHRDEIVSKLKKLIEIPSVRTQAEENAPFGKACAAVLERIQNLYENEGFETKLNQNDGYLLSYSGNGKKTLGIFAHADVVPVSDDWILTNPFEPIEKDGFLVGRGVLDDKSAVIISLFCVKMLKELNIPLKSRLVCFTGVNEESGMDDIKNYLSSHIKPDFSLVPDTCFPLYRGNKGRITFSMSSKLKLSKGVSIKGGTGATVIGEATATIPFKQSLFDCLSNYCDERISAEHNNETITLKAKGIAKHSAVPQDSLSAVSLLAQVLKDSDLPGKYDREIFENVYNMSSCHFGECFGIESCNEEMGNLTCVLTKTDTEDDGTLTAHFNIRYGTETDKDIIIGKICEVAEKIKWSLPEVSGFSVPHCLVADDAFVTRLLALYKDFAGWGESYINAGGTYRQYLQNAIETGTTNKIRGPEWLPKGHGGAHQPDECININGFLEAIEITLLMILECDRIMEDM